MKIISGYLKGRRIEGFNKEEIRPTSNRVKESLFHLIQNDIKDSICLDLFAGSGSLGIEAVSNGSKYVYLVDNSFLAKEILEKNINRLKINDQVKIIKNDCLKALENFTKENIKFNLIFLDPPYKSNIIDEVLDYIDNNNLLFKNGQVLCEVFKQKDLDNNYKNLIKIKEKKYGNKKIVIFKKIA